NDSFGRKVFDELQLSTGFVSRQFTYLTGEVTQEHVDNNMLKSSPTTQLVSQIVLSGGRTISYEYDEEERITKVDDSVDGITTYTYDALGQLVSEVKDNQTVNQMTYDNYGNILTKNGVEYTYGDENWKDLLTGVGDQFISYDAQGNPTSYLGHTLTWEKGRQLKSFDNIQFTYNANGIRTSKTVDGIRHDYTLDGAKILRETWCNNILVPLYDNEDSVCGIEYNGTAYYFLKNLQGDIIAITDSSGEEVARYSYDAWGVCTVTQDISNRDIANINPFRYRSYYFDLDTGLYYLQSRYYDPQVGRFVNGDMVEVAIFKQEVLEHNLFGYCSNNAIMNVDYNGYWKEYWGTFNSKQVGSFTLKLDNKRKEIKKKFGWVAWAGIAIAIVGAIVGAIFLSPAGGAVLGIGITLCTAGIQMLVDLYPNELDNIANSIRNALKKSKKKILKIYFLWGSHTNQIKITDNGTNKTYKKITIRTNAIQDLVTFAKNSNVKISSRDVKWQYSY
ncbi:MAG: hypothetical protein IKT42_05000, partial [Clostridia bacterium]|nr:hypothetical protein [Clostridia bacterium]